MQRLACLIAAFLLGSSVRADDAGVEHFEKAIRPLFVDNCIECHGKEKQSAGLRLDSVRGIRKGADDGPVVVAGKAKESRLIKAIQHTGEPAMPPKGKLPAEAIATLTAWVESGAAMPNEIEAAKVEAKRHWAFQPVKAPATGSIDEFIEAKLKEKGLEFGPPANPRDLIRRVYFDLIGLPPTAEEADDFAKNPSAAAYEKIVTKLLASPRYGERWARHWLDVARYADTIGYNFTADRNYPYAYTYRDYVIQSFNEDKSYQQFIIEQIAADRLELGNDNRALAALGFLTLGRRFNNNIHDIIDDRIEVVTRGFLGLSVGCARCHDHKFDPIPIRDYYSLYGVFAGSVEPKEPPLLNAFMHTREAKEFDAEVAKLEAAATRYYETMTTQALAKFRTADSIATYMLAARELRDQPANVVAKAVQERGLHSTMLARWRKTLESAKDDAIFLAWQAYAAIPPEQFAAKADTIRKLLAGNVKASAAVSGALNDARPSSLADVATIYGELLASALRSKAPTPDEAALRDRLLSTTRYEMLPEDDEEFVPIAVKKEYRKLRNAAQKYRATSPKAPPRAMALEDAPRPVNPVVFLRGNPLNRGDAVPRQFLEVIVPDRKPFPHGSGRLDLARAIADPKNPLTARVIVNRVWAWHFGRGLVSTPSDFGVRSDPPSHLELLDWLAAEFVRDGWSLKKLHAKIVLSAAYRQSSQITEKALRADPENILLSRFSRSRLEFEPMRDAMLAAAGTLDLNQVGGRSEEIFKTPFSRRRTVYAFIERQNLPGALRAFDLANPDQHVPQRHETTTPQQALFLMNSPFVADVAKGIVKRNEVSAAQDDESKIDAVYRCVLGRSPTERERIAAMSCLKDATPGKFGPWEQFAQILLMCNEFTFID